jgi:hypothetical protein
VKLCLEVADWHHSRILNQVENEVIRQSYILSLAQKKE